MNWRDFQRKQRVVEIGDTFLSYIDEGNGPPVVLLHGIPTWGYEWSTVLPVLASRSRVLIPDLAGFGYSDKNDWFNRSLVSQAALIERWMDAIGVPRAAFVGHDIGGGIALRMATLRPGRVDRLCLVNSVCYDSWPGSLMLALSHPDSHRRLSSRRINLLLRRGLRKGFSQASDELLTGLLAPYSSEVGKLSLIRNAVALNTNLTTETSSLLHQLRLPTVVISGEDDTFQPMKYSDRLARDIPGAQLVHLQKARHFLMLERPEIIAECLAQFLGPEGRVMPLPRLTPANTAQESGTVSPQLQLSEQS
jgi:pimeloyl-ACP methyl ester carboxylesterase